MAKTKKKTTRRVTKVAKRVLKTRRIKKSVKTSKTKTVRPTVVSFILDETGSMQSVKVPTISGFNEYINTLKNKAGELSFTLTKFNTIKTEIVHSGVPIADVALLSDQTYRPDNGTPLYDAIGRTILSLDADVSGRKDNPAILVVIMTDGEENASREFTREKVADMIKLREKKGWDFVYLGANHDAWQSAQSMGLTRGNTAQYDESNTTSVFLAAASATTRYVKGNVGIGTSSPRTALFNSGERTILESDVVVDCNNIDIDKLSKGTK